MPVVRPYLLRPVVDLNTYLLFVCRFFLSHPILLKGYHWLYAIEPATREYVCICEGGASVSVYSLTPYLHVCLMEHVMVLET